MHLHRDESGLAGTVLVIVIAWALAAVIMLTGTLIAARQIDARVAFITGEVGEIKADTRLVQLTDNIASTSGAILESASPLSDQLGTTNTAAASIDATANDILSTADSINGTVLTINSQVTDLEPTVTQINQRVHSINSSVNSIHASASGILANTDVITPNIHHIATQQADPILNLVKRIKADTGTIRHQVALRDYPSETGVLGHARSIDCSPAVFALSSACPDDAPVPLPGDLVPGDLLPGGGGGDGGGGLLGGGGGGVLP